MITKITEAPWYTYKPTERTVIGNRYSVPMGFNKAVIERLGDSVRVGSSYVSMVRRGKRTNDKVLMAIIEVDHNWKELERERLLKLL